MASGVPNLFPTRSGRVGSAVMDDRWLSVEEIAEYLGMSKDTVSTWLTTKAKPGHRIGHLWKFTCDEIKTWVHSGWPSPCA